MIKIKDDYYSDIRIEIQRYDQVIEYYKRNPERIKQNKAYLEMIKDRLIKISFFDEVSRESQNKSDKLLNFFIK